MFKWIFIITNFAYIFFYSQQFTVAHRKKHPRPWMDYLGKGEVLTNTDLDRFVNHIWAK